MTDPLTALQETLAALQAELATVKSELHELRSIVTFAGTGAERHAILRASALHLHPPGQPEHIAVQLQALPSGGIIALYPGTPEALATIKLASTPVASGIIVHSPQRESNFSLAVEDTFARLCVFHGEIPGQNAAASLTATPDGSNLILRRSDGTPGIEAHVFQDLAALHLTNRAGEVTAEFCLHGDIISTLNLFDPAGRPAVSAKAMSDSANFTVHCPGKPHPEAATLADDTGVRFFILQGQRPLILLSHNNETGGSLYVGGPTAESGQVHLQGGTVTGSLSLATADATTLLSLDASPHGGRLAINNDLGFQRVLLTTIQESSALVLNHTGQQGVIVAAGPEGGAITVHDSEGQVRATLPDGDE